MGLITNAKIAARRFVLRHTAYNEYDSYYRRLSYKNPLLKPNIKNLRTLAKTPIARSAINQIKDGVMSLPFQFVTTDGNEHYKEIEKLQHILNHPNQINTYKDWISQILDDLLVADMGCNEIQTITSNYQPLYVFPIDCGTLEVIEGWDGDPAQPRYAQYVNGEKKKFLDSEVSVISRNNFTHSYFGLSPTETAYKHIQYLIHCQEYADSLASDAMPKYLVNIGEEATQDDLDKVRDYIDKDVQGQSTLGILASKQLEAKQVSPIGDEATYLSWQKMLLQIISVCYRVPPERLGIGISNDRSTIAEQDEDFINHAIKPWASVIETFVQKYIVERLGYTFIQFKYIYAPTESKKTTIRENVLSCVKSDTITFNEARRCLIGILPIDELPPLPNGDIRLSEWKNQLNIDLAKVNGAANSLGDEKANNKGSDENAT